MNLTNIFSVAAAVLASLGGGAVIVFSFSNWLGKVWANRLMERDRAQYQRDIESLKNELLRDTESYKVKLRKSEFIFEKEFEAASEFVALFRGFLPSYSSPGMDFYEACDGLADNFGKIEHGVGEFITKHGAVLPSDVVDQLQAVEGIAAEYYFDVHRDGGVSKATNDAAANVYEKLKIIEKALISQVRTQSST